MKKLVIVESPTKANTLKKFLGGDYEVQSSMGHIRDLPKSGLGVDVEHNFKPEYVIPEKAEKVVRELKKHLKACDSIILATDPDREGEAIAWHLYNILAPDLKRGSTKAKKDSITKDKLSEYFSRVVFHELTKDAIEEAFAHPGTLNLDLVDAQQARRVLDRLVGYKLSPLLWKKVRFGLSAGRVQSVAVRLVVERERERQAFKSEEYWSIEGEFKCKHGMLKAVLATKDDTDLKITSQRQADVTKAVLLKDTYLVDQIKTSERQRRPYPPFKTSTLQQAASNIFGYNAKKTMDIAQKLFEKGYITYHRTDSLNLAPSFIDKTRKYIIKKFGKEYLPNEAIFYKTKTKTAQEAHEAIRPTSVDDMFEKKLSLSKDEYNIYSLVWKRALESQMLPAIYDQTSIIIKSSSNYTFKANGSVIKFDGWLAVGTLLKITNDADELLKLPPVLEKEKLTLRELIPEQHFTQPPARYSDATLIKALEELEIGRPSTYAPTISTIQTRGYITRDGRYFAPTDVAFVVTNLLVKYFPDVIDYKFTAILENEFDEIANGEKKWEPVVEAFYGPFEKDILEKEESLSKSDITTLGTTEEKCPECGKNLIIKLGRYGKFLSCSGYPDCKYAKPMEDDASTDENGEPINYGKCENCKDGIMVVKHGRFGKFLACSNYPKCKTTKPFLEKIGVKCPKCGDGDIVLKKAKGRVFYGCSRYPDCDYSSWKKPTEDTVSGENAPKSTKASPRRKSTSTRKTKTIKQ